jgi:tRNA pseudouridine38-40 synthase
VAGPGEPVARLRLEYDGRPFAGWAEQPGRRTVAGDLRAALETVLRRPVALTAAGRTDRGVHATGQVVSYPGPLPPLRSLNAVLPREIAVPAADAMPPGFSARHDARSRTYRYRITTRQARSPFEVGRALWWRHPVDDGALHACAAALAGQHDFTAFTPTETQHVFFHRTVLRAAWRRAGDELEFEIEADAFLRSMNRVLVGTMLEVAGGRRSMADFIGLLGGAPRSAAGPTAPAHGLYLVAVGY